MRSDVTVEDLLALLIDALFALENVGVEPDLCERIRQVLRTGDDNPVQKVEPGLWDEMGF